MKELKRFCSFDRFLKYKRPTLYSLYEDLCLLSLLVVKNQEVGGTFLLPSKKAVEKIPDFKVKAEKVHIYLFCCFNIFCNITCLKKMFFTLPVGQTELISVFRLPFYS